MNVGWKVPQQCHYSLQFETSYNHHYTSICSNKTPKTLIELLAFIYFAMSAVVISLPFIQMSTCVANVPAGEGVSFTLW